MGIKTWPWGQHAVMKYLVARYKVNNKELDTKLIIT